MNKWDTNGGELGSWDLDSSRMSIQDKVEMWARQAQDEVWLEMNNGRERKLVRRVFRGIRWEAFFEALEDDTMLEIQLKMPIVTWKSTQPAVDKFLKDLARVVRPGHFISDDTGTTILYARTLDLAHAPLNHARFEEFFIRALAIAFTFLRDFDTLTAGPAPAGARRCTARTPRRPRRSRGRRAVKHRGRLHGAYQHPSISDLGDLFS